MTEEEEMGRKLWAALHSGPAPFVNRFGINQIPGGAARLAFVEWLDNSEEPQFRSAVVMAGWELYQLWQILGDLPQVKEAAASAAAAAAEANDASAE